jgi:hypothetical protein
MIKILIRQNKSFFERQLQAISDFHRLQEDSLGRKINFETAFYLWLNQGYAERFRQLFLLRPEQHN